jgi:hypothetical protein
MELLRLHIIRVHNGTRHFFFTAVPATTDYMLTIYDLLQFFANVRCSHAESLK